MHQASTDVRRPHGIGILCGGGPAPGINSVIAAATIQATLADVPVYGIHDGFKRLMQGDITCAVPLRMADASRIHFTGGSYVGSSRGNPTRDAAQLATVATTLSRSGIDALITIGGDDTAFSATRLAAQAHGGLQVAHVPKSIDNDLEVPYGMPTCGFETARHLGVQLVKNLMTDARTTGRWYLVVTMGRKAGHLALAIGKAAGTTLTLIPEEFDTSASTDTARIALDHLCDIIIAAMVKRRVAGHRDGTVVLAEGLIERLRLPDLEQFGPLERDEYGNVRLSQVNFGEVLKRRLRTKFSELGLEAGLVATDIGYELRCADPIPFDLEYTRDLGYSAAQFVIDGGTDAMIALVNGHFQPVPLSRLLDPSTGRTRVRMVDTDSEQYRIARAYMVRLNPEDLEDAQAVEQMAAVLHLTAAEFTARFGYLVSAEGEPRK